MRAFPAKAGSLSATDPEQLGYWAGVERAAGRNKKRSPSAAIEQVAQEHVEVETGGTLLLDRISYRELRTLRANDEFQDSLWSLHQEWAHSSDYSFFVRVLRAHIDLIYRILGAKKRSSPLRSDGPNVLVKVWHSSELPLFLTEVGEFAYRLIDAVPPHGSPTSIERFVLLAFVSSWITIANLYRWTQPKQEWHHLADRVGLTARSSKVVDDP